MKYEPRRCLWSGLLFRPQHAGQMFATREAAMAFERSGQRAVLLDPKHNPVLEWETNRKKSDAA